jgi:hypothetical protein
MEVFMEYVIICKNSMTFQAVSKDGKVLCSGYSEKQVEKKAEEIKSKE